MTRLRWRRWRWREFSRAPLDRRQDGLDQILGHVLDAQLRRGHRRLGQPDRLPIRGDVGAARRAYGEVALELAVLRGRQLAGEIVAEERDQLTAGDVRRGAHFFPR